MHEKRDTNDDWWQPCPPHPWTVFDHESPDGQFTTVLVCHLDTIDTWHEIVHDRDSLQASGRSQEREAIDGTERSMSIFDRHENRSGIRSSTHLDSGSSPGESKAQTIPRCPGGNESSIA